MNTGASQRIHAHAYARGAYHVEIDHAAMVIDVGAQKIVLSRGRDATRAFERYALHVLQVSTDKRVRPGFDPAGGIDVRGSAVRRVVFEATIVGWIVRRRDHDAVGKSALAPAVVDENRMRHRRRRRIFTTLRDTGFDAVGGQHFER